MVLVISTYTAVVHVKLENEVGRSQQVNGQIEMRKKMRVEMEKQKKVSSKLPWSIKDPRCKKQHLSFYLQWALEGIMSHNISVVQSACRYFNTSL